MNKSILLFFFVKRNVYMWEKNVLLYIYVYYGQTYIKDLNSLLRFVWLVISHLLFHIITKEDKLIRSMSNDETTFQYQQRPIQRDDD